jgi:3-oxoacyl-[acyl-carrier protein] reductase
MHAAAGEIRELEGLVALVSGAAGGIGRATAEMLRECGARVVGFDLSSAGEGEELWVEGDVGDESDAARAVQAAVETHGRLDILVHAAGITRDQVLWKLPVDDWDEVLRVNLRGAYLLLREAFPAMREGDGGRVVLLGSINGSRGKFGQTAYAASKAGLLGLARSAAKEGGRFGITVNVVEPGMVDTPMTQALPAEIRDAAVAESVLGRLAQPEDIASAIRYLCGPGGRHVTGQILRVDGGQYC